MNDSSDLLNKIRQSDTCLIGFTSFKYESASLQLISELPTYFVPSGKYEDVMKFFDNKKNIRDMRLNNILNGVDKHLYLVIYMDDIEYDNNNPATSPMYKFKKESDLIQYFKQHCYQSAFNGYLCEEDDDKPLVMKLILLRFVRKTPASSATLVNINIPQNLIYEPDLVLSISDDFIRIEKDRSGDNLVREFPTLQTLRDIKIDRIFKNEDSK